MQGNVLSASERGIEQDGYRFTVVMLEVVQNSIFYGTNRLTLKFLQFW